VDSIETLSLKGSAVNKVIGLKLKIVQAIDEGGVLLAHASNSAELILIEEMTQSFLLAFCKISAVNQLIVDCIYISGIELIKK